MNLIKRNTVPLPSIIDELLKPDWLGGIQSSNTVIPAVNIKETDTDFVIELAAPGLKKEDFSIEIDHNVLTISSQTKTEKEEVNEKYTRKEFGFTSFKRAFTLPESVNTETILANYESGILNITLPKKEEALPKPKRIIDIV